VSKAREIAETRFAKGEITEQEFLTIIERLKEKIPEGLNESSVTKQQTFSTDRQEHEPTRSEEPDPAQASPEMLRHYSSVAFKSDLLLPAKIVGFAATATITSYVLAFIILMKKQENLNSFNEWLNVFGAETADSSVDSLIMIFAIPQLVLLIAGLVWIYRANKNLFFFRISGLKFSPGWSVGWFFIPVAFFWMPLKAVHQVYAGSRVGDSWENTPINNTVLLWWILFWVAGLLEMLLPSSISSLDETTGVLVIYGICFAASVFSVDAFSDLVKNTTEAQNSLSSESLRHTDVR